MEAQLPREIQVIDLWPASIRFVLPRRDLGRGKFLGWLLLILGVVAMAAAVYLGLAMAGQAAWVLGRFLRGMAFVLSLITVGGLVPLWWGLAALVGHREIEIRGDRIRTIERIGPFWRSKRWKLDKISRFDCVDPSADNDGQVPGFLERCYALLVRLDGGRQGMLAWGYGPELLRPLGEALTERGNAALQRSGQAATIGPAGAKAAEEQDFDEDEDWGENENDDNAAEREEEWSEVGSDAADAAPALTQPAGSLISVEKFEGGLTIRVPAAGLWKGTSGLFFFALLWNGFMTVFTSMALCIGLQAENQPDETALWIFPLFITAFWAVGIGLLLGALNMGRRSAMFAVAAGRLLVMQTGIFGTKQREWPVDGIASVRTGGSGMEVNDRPVLELQIHPQEGKKFGLLAGRSELELEWLAHELQRAVTLAQKETPPAARPPMAE